ncbi:hypothetical protein TUBRATIS_21390 [Tubulinosema ratisbonensis]|uniref:Uncharacterized protein n=1 Tax=Tubulinosema ratisbonensis TaxID=291195 RepID=A0A437AJQ6_9MICR|nr:hypothetical protein TUBRATIS_21390 [Tubulinosema ratisbonensis]
MEAHLFIINLSFYFINLLSSLIVTVLALQECTLRYFYVVFYLISFIIQISIYKLDFCVSTSQIIDLIGFFLCFCLMLTSQIFINAFVGNFFNLNWRFILFLDIFYLIFCSLIIWNNYILRTKNYSFYPFYLIFIILLLCYQLEYFSQLIIITLIIDFILNQLKSFYKMFNITSVLIFCNLAISIIILSYKLIITTGCVEIKSL